ncbi:alpha/beta fold hydrolase [Alkalibaculum sp. M08DMB]|uniref:Alpha/beta fold hydrolase n=1 Tax=Alkalibaculum sporogenes TaxID=2655001 RepID=A0A6A7K5U1_9FIRM|nr:alpha/beta fold hydrolase [Alkalibaculum sporogenes]
MIKPKYTGCVSVNTAKIFYQVFGENQRTIIFLHGNGEDWNVFYNQIKPCSKHFKVVTIDSRGHGKSTFGSEQLSITIMANDVIEVMNELNITRADVIGFSDGGNIAIQLALKYPQRIEKLVIAGANLYPRGIKTIAQIPTVLKFYFYMSISLFSNRAKEQLQILNLMVNNPKFKIENLKGIKTPTLVLAGEDDMIKEEHTELIANSISNSSLEIIPNTSHFIFYEEPHKVNAIIISYLLGE